MKQLVYILIAILSIAMVSATTIDIVPDCGGPNTWPDVCDEFDLQDEFSEVSDVLNHNIRNADLQQEEIDLNREGVIYNTGRSIENQFYLTGEIEDREELEAYIARQKSIWDVDKEGGGISLSKVSLLLFGNKDVFDTSGETLMDKLYKIFSKHEELEQANQRIDILEARLNALEAQIILTSTQLSYESDVIRASRLNLWSCDIANKCFAILPK